MDYFLYVNDQRLGPYSRDELQALFQTEQITAETPAWHEGLEDWSTVGTFLQPAAEQVARETAVEQIADETAAEQVAHETGNASGRIRSAGST